MTNEHRPASTIFDAVILLVLFAWAVIAVKNGDVALTVLLCSAALLHFGASMLRELTEEVKKLNARKS
jgi:hypothetical protein